MYRTSLISVKEWFLSPRRKPLVIRGARQVGKTWLVKHFAETEGLELIDVNLEKAPELAKLFHSNNPEEIIQELGNKFHREIDPSKSLLFIDEIHRLRPQIEEILYSAMEDYRVDIMIGSGTGATSVRMDIPRFTLIGATTKLSSLSSPLRDRFGNVLKLDLYEQDEIAKIVARSFSLL